MVSTRYRKYVKRKRARAAAGAVPASARDKVSPYDPVFGPGVNLDDSALDAYGQPYRIAGAPVADARPRIAPDEKTATEPGKHDKATTSHFDKKTKFYKIYTHLPTLNIQNTDTGYRLYQSGLIAAKAPKP